MTLTVTSKPTVTVSMHFGHVTDADRLVLRQCSYLSGPADRLTLSVLLLMTLLKSN